VQRPEGKTQSRRAYSLVLVVSAAVFCFSFLKKEEWGFPFNNQKVFKY